MHACSQGLDGLLFWINAFAWIAEPRKKIIEGPMSGLHVFPWISWPIQDVSFAELYNAIEEEDDLLIEKSRDMGATWNSLAAFLWFWLFHPNTWFLCTSRKEEFVDKAGSPKCHFWKLMFLLKRLPPWMIPEHSKTHMHLENLENGSVIDGESTNIDIGRGDRLKAILLDEFAANADADKVLAATADAGCRLFNSTPRGAGSYDEHGQLRGNAFAALRHSGRLRVFTLHWSDHPVKGKDRKKMPAPSGVVKWSSPWYVSECHRRISKVEIAQELDIDYAGAGNMFFDSDVLSDIKLKKQCTPPRRAELSFTVKTIEMGQKYEITLGELEYTPDGILSIWEEPGQDNYASFADISAGTGASNSCLHVGSVGRRVQVASLLTPFLSPEVFARYATAVNMWYAGQTEGAFHGWEANGIGEVYGREVWRLGYRKVLGNVNQRLMWNPQDGNKVGWYSDPNKKVDFLADYRSALAHREYIVRDEELVAELETYVNYETGGVGPSQLVSDSSGAKKAHGDRVMAAAGVLMCIQRQPVFVNPTEGPGFHSMDYFDAEEEAAKKPKSRMRVWSPH